MSTPKRPTSRQPRTATQARQGSDSRSAPRATRRRSRASWRFALTPAPPRSLKLADAQLDSRPRGRLRRRGRSSSADLQERDVKAFCEAVRHGDIPAVRQLLASPHVRKRINDPMFAFGQRAAHIAAKNAAMLTVADRRRRRREPEERMGERPLHRARQRRPRRRRDSFWRTVRH